MKLVKSRLGPSPLSGQYIGHGEFSSAFPVNRSLRKLYRRSRVHTLDKFKAEQAELAKKQALRLNISPYVLTSFSLPILCDSPTA